MDIHDIAEFSSKIVCQISIFKSVTDFVSCQSCYITIFNHTACHVTCLSISLFLVTSNNRALIVFQSVDDHHNKILTASSLVFMGHVKGLAVSNVYKSLPLFLDLGHRLNQNLFLVALMAIMLI